MFFYIPLLWYYKYPIIYVCNKQCTRTRSSDGGGHNQPVGHLFLWLCLVQFAMENDGQNRWFTVRYKMVMFYSCVK